jgi:predicted acyltransferase
MSSLLFALTTLGILSMVAWVMQRRGWALKL